MSADAHEKPDIFVPADVVADPGDASAAWRRALKELLGDKQRFHSWREQRYAFAHRVGTLLTEAHPPTPAATGPALYGVYLPGTGLCYVGQTQEARRRLRDLPIGESHHLAMTAPPELWTRVIVVQWAELLVRATEREWVIPDMKACGQALEYLLHCHFRPTINCYARTTDGRYRERPPERSKSKAAVGAIEHSDLFKVVLGVWSSLEAVPEPTPGESRVADYGPFGRVIFPAALLDSGLFEVNRDRVVVRLPGVSSWRWCCVSAVVCRGCTQCGRACAGLPGCGTHMPGGLRAWRAGSGFRKRNS